MAFRPRLATGLAVRVMTCMLGEGSTHTQKVAQKKMPGSGCQTKKCFFRRRDLARSERWAAKYVFRRILPPDEARVQWPHEAEPLAQCVPRQSLGTR